MIDSCFFYVGCQLWNLSGVGCQAVNLCVFNDDRQTFWSSACRLPIEYIDGKERKSIDQ